MSSLVGVRNLTCDKGGMTGVEAAWVGVTVAIWAATCWATTAAAILKTKIS